MISSGKFQRNYRLDIYTPAGELISIAPPFSIQFTVTRNVLASANTVSMTLFNLGPGTRNRIYKDRYTLNEYWRAQLFAGYGQRLHEVFRGNRDIVIVDFIGSPPGHRNERPYGDPGTFQIHQEE